MASWPKRASHGGLRRDGTDIVCSGSYDMKAGKDSGQKPDTLHTHAATYNAFITQARRLSGVLVVIRPCQNPHVSLC